MKTLLRPKTRRYIYRVTAAGLAAAAVWGVLDGTQVAALLVVAAAVCGLADVNVDTSEPDA